MDRGATMPITGVSDGRGKISGETLSTWHRLPIEQRTYTFDITGPELGIWLFGGPANATESVDCWVYLTS